MDRSDGEFRHVAPRFALADFVERYWLPTNPADTDREIVPMPDGRMELLFSRTA